MKNLLKKFVSRKKSTRMNRRVVQSAVSFQIAKMGKMGQQLVVASR